MAFDRRRPLRAVCMFAAATLVGVGTSDCGADHKSAVTPVGDTRDASIVGSSSTAVGTCAAASTVTAALGRLRRSFLTGDRRDVEATVEPAGTPTFRWFLFRVNGAMYGVGGPYPDTAGAVESFVAQQSKAGIRLDPRVAQVLNNASGAIGIALVVQRTGADGVVGVVDGKGEVNCSTGRFAMLMLSENPPEPTVAQWKQSLCPHSKASHLVVCQ